MELLLIIQPYPMTPETYKAIRERLGLTQAELADRLGVSRKTINARETGNATITKEAGLALSELAGNESR